MAIRKNQGSVKKSTGGANTAVKSFFVRFRVLILLVGLIFALGIVGGVVWFVAIKAPGTLFTLNRNFSLQRVEVVSSDYWRGNKSELMRRAGLRFGYSIFYFDLGKVRHNLETRLDNVSRAEVFLRLPDTLEIRLQERIPRARLNSRTSPYAVDREGMKINLDQTVSPKIHLPVITDVNIGKDFRAKVLPAVLIVMQAEEKYPDLKIIQLSVANSSYVEFYFTWKNDFRFKALFPSDLKDYTDLLNKLQNAIMQAGRMNSPDNCFDLRVPNHVYTSKVLR